MYHTDFGVSYDTAMRYVMFPKLIKRYPRLIICDQSYAQITKHQKRLLEYLKTDSKLQNKLSQPLNVSIQGKAIEIQPADIGIPKVKLSTDPD
jgi:hypothetical protein